MKKLYIIGGQVYLDYVNWILPLGFKITSIIQEADLCVATGGEDWHPNWYHKGTIKPHNTLSCNIYRDKQELMVLEKAINLKIPIVGICRGSQIFPVLAGEGGKIVQHQNNPAYKHLFKTYDGKELVCTSSHHNAAYPYNLPKDSYELLGWSENLLNYRFLNSEEQDLESPETEVVYYPKIKCLGFQMHPEWQLKDEESMKWYADTLNKFLFNK